MELAGRQFNRVSRQQLLELGLSADAIDDLLASGRLARAEEGVFAIAPLLTHDPWGRWMGATLTSPGSVLSHASAGAAADFWTPPRAFEIITRPGNGGPRHHGGVLVFRSRALDGDVTELDGIPITTVPRTLLDLACHVSNAELARAIREAVRLRKTSVDELGDRLGAYRGRRGAGRLARALARYAGLPLQRARSGAEIRALEVLRDAGRRLPNLNVRLAGEEADLSWPSERLIIEVDGRPFHLDAGEDARKQAAWEAAGWTVRRIPSDDVYERPRRLLDLAPPA